MRFLPLLFLLFLSLAASAEPTRTRPHRAPAKPVQVATYAPPLEPFNSPAPQRETAGGPTVSGRRAVIRGGIAYAPAEAPAAVKKAIWATNAICRRPYRMGGGHGSFNDTAYDCSGTISYALHHAGVLSSPVSSSELASIGSSGAGRWITIYAAPGRHVFANIAGLRLDTTDFRRGGDVGPRWHEDARSTSGFSTRHLPGL